MQTKKQGELGVVSLRDSRQDTVNQATRKRSADSASSHHQEIANRMLNFTTLHYMDCNFFRMHQNTADDANDGSISDHVCGLDEGVAPL
jgi:hypothetical protein